MMKTEMDERVEFRLEERPRSVPSASNANHMDLLPGLGEKHGLSSESPVPLHCSPRKSAVGSTEGKEKPNTVEADGSQSNGVVELEEEDNNEYPRGWKLATLTMALMLATFMVALDTNVIGTAIPTMTAHFNSLNDVGWYGSAYLLTLMALQPMYGKIYTYFNTKRVFLVALFIFELGSTICAAAPSSTVFIVGRALSGSGAAGILSGALTLGAHLVPLVKRPLYMSIIMSMYGVAAVAGPTLGGVFTDSKRLTWRFCFWLNLPFGGLAVVICAILLEPYTAPQGSDLSVKVKLSRLDFPGVILSILTAVLLLLALKWGGLDYAWDSSPVLGCLVGFAVCLMIFIITQARQKQHALISLHILSQRSVLSGSLFICFLNMAIDTHIYYLPLYFQAVDGTSASASGVRILPYLGTMIISAVVSGSCISLLGYYVPFMILGSALFTVGCALLHNLGVNSGPAHWVGYQLLAGIGFGMAFQIPYSALHVILDVEDLPTGNALLVFYQALGGALAVSVAQNILSNELLERLKALPQIQDPQAIVTAGATNIAKVVPGDLVHVVVDAYSYALSKTFILPVAAAGMAFLCSLGMEWKTITKEKGDK